MSHTEIELTVRVRTDGDADDAEGIAQELATFLGTWVDYSVFDPGYPAVDYRVREGRPHETGGETEHLYRKCRHCHLFVEPNPAFGDAPGLAEFTHLHRGEGEDVLLDESHEPEPEDEAHPLEWWKQYGPYAMRVRFTDYRPPAYQPGEAS